MPSQIAHILLGHQAVSVLPPNWIQQWSDAAFRLGCQGPDVFYHNRHTKPGAFLYGTRLHRRGWGDFLSRFRREALDRGWGPEHPGMAFLAGQVTHGFLDRQAHPFVVSFSGWRVPGDSATESLRHSHAFFERILDVCLWNHFSKTPLESCRWQENLPGPEDFPADFWIAWAEALHEVFPQLSARADVETRLKNAVSDTRGFLSFTSPGAAGHAVRAARHGALHFFHPIALPGWDFLNMTSQDWPDPLTGQARQESFPQLFERALVEARHTLTSITEPAVGWTELLGNGSLNLPGADGVSLAPKFCRPWDFSALYDREVEARLSARV